MSNIPLWIDARVVEVGRWKKIQTRAPSSMKVLNREEPMAEDDHRVFASTTTNPRHRGGLAWSKVWEGGSSRAQSKQVAVKENREAKIPDGYKPMVGRQLFGYALKVGQVWQSYSQPLLAPVVTEQ